MPRPKVGEPPEARDTSQDEYRIWLTSKYEISKNDALDKIVCQDKLFETVDDALLYADSLEKVAAHDLEAREQTKATRLNQAQRMVGSIAKFTGYVILVLLAIVVLVVVVQGLG